MPINSERLWVNDMTVFDVFKKINDAADFSLAESWDNCGILVGSSFRDVKKILTCLDITCDVAREAIDIGADLVVSHHPVIFKGLKSLDDNNPAVMLSKAGVSAICCHTNVDIAAGGLNSFLCEKLGFKEIAGLPLAYDEGSPIGIVCESENELSGGELAKLLVEVLGCDALRFYDSGKEIKRIGICTGSGSDFLGDALRNKCDVLITGDVKHSAFTEAKNSGVSLFDAGHYHTECIFSEWIERIIDGVKISRAKADKPPYQTVF